MLGYEEVKRGSICLREIESWGSVVHFYCIWIFKNFMWRRLEHAYLLVGRICCLGVEKVRLWPPFLYGKDKEMKFWLRLQKLQHYWSELCLKISSGAWVIINCLLDWALVRRRWWPLIRRCLQDEKKSAHSGNSVDDIRGHWLLKGLKRGN